MTLWSRSRVREHAALIVFLSVMTRAREAHSQAGTADAATDAIAADAFIGTMKVCPVMVDLGNGMGDISADLLQRTFLTGPGSASAFYFENSYGRFHWTGEVFGPYPFKLSGCNNDAMAQELKAMVPAGRCDQYAFVFPRVQDCPWAGLGRLDGTATGEPLSWYNGFEALSCTTVVQEPGHNYGMRHSSSITCGKARFLDDPIVCSEDEYGDTFDAMGGGCRHFNVWQKQFMKWLPACNAIKVTSSGTFSLLPAELRCDGVQSIQVPFPGGKTRSFVPEVFATDLTSYYLEYRTSVGFDQGVAPEVLVHVGLDPSTSAGSPTWLVNASGIWAHPGLTSGDSFVDPAGGLTITVKALTAAMATIEITYANGSGGPTCADGMALPLQQTSTCVGVASLAEDSKATTPSGCSCVLGRSMAGALRPTSLWQAVFALATGARRLRRLPRRRKLES